VSLENARRHWRFLAMMLLVFVALAAAGPLLFYGLPSLLEPMMDRFGSSAVVLLGVVFAAVTLGWLFFVLWVGDRADHLALGDNEDEDNEVHG
jgi:hypothetical protein